MWKLLFLMYLFCCMYSFVVVVDCVDDYDVSFSVVVVVAEDVSLSVAVVVVVAAAVVVMNVKRSTQNGKNPKKKTNTASEASE